LASASIASATGVTWGSGWLVLRREAKWGRAPAEASADRVGSPVSSGVPAGVRPEDALCDFAKMVFTDPS
jgi:hypothetical protein